MHYGSGLLGLLLAATAPGQVRTVADLNTDPVAAGLSPLARTEAPSGRRQTPFTSVEMAHLGGFAWFVVPAPTGSLLPGLYRTRGAGTTTELVLSLPNGNLLVTNPDRLTVQLGRLWIAGAAAGGSPRLWVTDGTAAGLPPTPLLDGAARDFAAVNGGVVFSLRQTGTTADELWFSDGTPGGSRPIPGVVPSGAKRSLGGVVVFAGDDGSAGAELWRTDGTAAGTSLVSDLWPGADGSGPAAFHEVAGRAVFEAADPVHGRELWTTDGTAAGTALLADTVAGAASGVRLDGAASDGAVLLFAARDGATGFEPWITDGTTAGTRRIADLAPGADSSLSPFASGPYAWHAAGRFWFAADAGAGRELWTTDGTPGGTRPVTDFASPFLSTYLGGFVALDENRALFWASERATGIEPWVSDGTAAGTLPLGDLHPGSSSSGPGAIGRVPGGLVFAADTPGLGSELWFTEGTPAGTTPLADLAQANGSAEVREPRRVGSEVAFLGDDAAGSAVWLSDAGAGPGATRRVAPTSQLRVLNELMLFPAGNQQTTVTAGGAEAAVLPFEAPAGFPLAAARLGDGLVAANNGLFSRELWFSAGTSASTRRLVAATSAAPTALPSIDGLVAHGDEVLFAVRDRSSAGFWSTDGTAAGTRLLQRSAVFGPLGGLTGSSGPFSLGRRAVYFVASGADVGLWSIGPPIGPPQRITSGTIAAFLGSDFARWRDRGLYRDGDVTTGAEPWVTDGTSAGTVSLGDLRPGPASSAARDWIPARALAWFTADDGVHGRELWCTDGTAAGTRRLTDLRPGAASSFPPVLGQDWPTHVIGDRLYFVGDDDVRGPELWTSDGTTAGTRLVAELVPGPDGSFPGSFATLGDRLFFVAADLEGVAAWISDGTASGTTRLTPALVGFQGAGERVRPIGSRRLAFAWQTAAHGDELWLTDGTPAGTALVADLYPGNSSSAPELGPVLWDELVFAATTPDIGRELRALPLGATATPVGRGYATWHSAPRLDASDPVVGQSFEVTAEVDAGAAALLVLGLPLRRPESLAPGLSWAGARVWFDRGGPLDPTALWTNPSGATLRHTESVPNTPALLGVRLVAQLVVTGTDSTPGFDLSNAVQLALGR